MRVLEVPSEVRYVELGEFGQGKIEPNENNLERLDELTQRAGSGEFHTLIPFDETLNDTEILKLLIVAGCIDGRCGCSLKPNSAGGTESLMVADDLVNQQFASGNGTTLGAYKNILSFLAKNGYQIGGHDALNARGGTGCGANEKLADIYRVIAEEPELLQSLAEKIGVKVNDETSALLAANAAKRLGSVGFSESTELLSALESTVGTKKVDHLEGTHREVLIVINYRYGETLDREAVRREFGDEYQIFNIDAWAFQNTANLISTTPDAKEAMQKVAALAYYNLATGRVLCGPKIRVVLLD